MKQPFDSFYLSYQAISQTLSDQSLSVHSERSIFLEQAGDLLMPKFTLSWSHYKPILILYSAFSAMPVGPIKTGCPMPS